MKSNRHARVLCVVSAVLASFVLSTAAEATGPYYRPSVPARMGRKFLRGVGNVAFCFMEIPKSINEETQLLDPFAGTFTGLFKGVGMTVERAVVGVYEIATFPVPMPRGYKQIMTPEFVMMEDTRTWRDRIEETKY